jgi:hypothetical protein
MLSKDLMFDVDSNASDEDEDDIKGGTMNGLDKHQIDGMHGNTTNDIFGDANNNAHVLGQKGQELNIHIHLLTKRSLMLSLDLEVKLFLLGF